MDTVFIVNPKAGQGKNLDTLINQIKLTNSRCYITKSVGDAETFVRDYCKNKGSARFIACGGDGTFNEVLNGVAECADAEIGVLPLGTGNDFCRNFDGDFSDINTLINSPAVKTDAIRYTTFGVTRLCANMFNIGFDCNVADLTANMKKKPLISGSLAYFLSILAMLIKKKGTDIEIEIDGKTFYNGKLLLTSVANGKYCGGGIMSNPFAEVSNGYINVNVVYNVSRLKFITLLPHYMKGTHMGLKNIDKVICNQNCKTVKITPNTENFRICVDGEIQDAHFLEFEIVPNAFNMVIPKANKENINE